MATKKYVSLEKLGLYDEKIKKVISDSDAAMLAEAKGYADSLAENYDAAGSAATVQGKLGEEVERAVARENEIAAANTQTQEALDDLEELVGVLPTGTSASTVVEYVNAKTAGIATDAALAELSGQVGGLQTDVQTIKSDYLKEEDKTELSEAIAAEAARADGKEKANAAAIKVISDDYLKNADKEALQGGINLNAEAIAAIKEDVDTFFKDADMTASAKDTLKELQEYISADETGAAAMTASIKANSDAIDVIEGKMETAEGKIETLEGEMDDAQAAILALQEAVGSEGSVGDMIDSAVNTEKLRAEGKEAEILAIAQQGVSDAATAAAAAENASKHADELDQAMDLRMDVVEAKAHEHSNKSLLDTYDQTNANIKDAVEKKHAHENAGVLNGINASDVTLWNTVSAKATTAALTEEVGRATAAEAALDAKISAFEECSEADINGLFTA